jgi:hypothetical protein
MRNAGPYQRISSHRICLLAAALVAALRLQEELTLTLIDRLCTINLDR